MCESHGWIHYNLICNIENYYFEVIRVVIKNFFTNASHPTFLRWVIYNWLKAVKFKLFCWRCDFTVIKIVELNFWVYLALKKKSKRKLLDCISRAASVCFQRFNVSFDRFTALTVLSPCFISFRSIFYLKLSSLDIFFLIVLFYRVDFVDCKTVVAPL